MDESFELIKCHGTFGLTLPSLSLSFFLKGQKRL